MKPGKFTEWLTKLTGHTAPRDWQAELASEQAPRSRLIRIPTGLGKTQGVLSAWSYHRVLLSNGDWPRRLVWCLPMRVLVEQTREVAESLCRQIDEEARPTVHVLMGGEDSGDWFLHPERPAILIGTQDMLLSRALNRGYASPRARWPAEFGLLNHDSLWVMDEVQLMDVGLATSAQLQAIRDEDGPKGFRPCHTWWMSATLQPDWLKSIDTAEKHREWVERPCCVPDNERSGGLWDVSKSISTVTISESEADKKAFAKRVLEEHQALKDGEFGRITLVVCNTVERACRTFDALQEMGGSHELELVHSRFRPHEREAWREKFLSRGACTRSADRIIVATQVVEAGVDISAGCLVTELAPWPSLVQRFGRCARYGGTGRVLVVDRGHDEKRSAPYRADEMHSAWYAIQRLPDVGIKALERHEAGLSDDERRQLFPYSPAHLLLRKEYDELFDTTPDLTGADLDISRFIRSGEERDLQVFWIRMDKEESHSPKRQPLRDELCAVPILQARDWLCGEESKTNRKPKLRSDMRAWVWDWIDGEWGPVTRAALIPGRVVCVATASGGYREDRGFDPEWRKPVNPVFGPSPVDKNRPVNGSDDSQDDEELSVNQWKTIACHTREVVNEVIAIAQQLDLPSTVRVTLELAACWHDWGKSHPAFQGAMKEEPQRPDRVDLAKGPDAARRKPPAMYRYRDGCETRPGFRHELASTLGLFGILQTYAPRHEALLGRWMEVLEQMGVGLTESEPPRATTPLIDRLLTCRAEEFDLVAYLVASHHGKVRVAFHAAPKDQEYRDGDGRGLPIRGVREGDALPSVRLVPDEPPLPEVVLTLSPAMLGLSNRTGISWRERTLGLAERHGPAALAFLEAILRAADVRASRLTTSDPALNEVGTE